MSPGGSINFTGATLTRESKAPKASPRLQHPAQHHEGKGREGSAVPDPQPRGPAPRVYLCPRAAGSRCAAAWPGRSWVGAAEELRNRAGRGEKNNQWRWMWEHAGGPAGDGGGGSSASPGVIAG